MILPQPEPKLRASIVVPAKDEEELVGLCIHSLATQTGVTDEEYEVLLVLDLCADATAERALEAASEHRGFRLHLLEGPGLGAGHARRVGMEEACSRLLALERPGALVASTDADTVVAPDWLANQLAAVEQGMRAIGGRIELSRGGERLCEELRSWRDSRGEARRLYLLERQEQAEAGSRTEHWQFSGASMSLTAEAYREVGGLEPRAALEDEHLEHALERCGIPIDRPLDVRVSTSPRLVGRASRGLAKDLSLASWLRANTYQKPPPTPAHLPEDRISVIAPTRDGATASCPREIAGVDLILVPQHGTEAPLTDRFGPVRGRGDALWRGLSQAEGELIVLLPEPPAESLAAAPTLLAPLLEREELEMVKGYPASGVSSELSRLVGAPMINLHHPELAGLVDPLSGFVAARRDLLESLPFPVGPGVDASLLLDTAHSRGAGSIAQTALPPLPEPSPASAEDSYATIAVFLARSQGGAEDIPSPAPLALPDPHEIGFDSRRVRIEERPPLKSFDRSSAGSGETFDAKQS